MAEQAGNLHWRRMRIPSLVPGDTDIDTGLTLVNLAYNTLEPPIGVIAAVEPALGALPASRVQVIPMPPTALWDTITIGEPWFSTVTQTVHVTFTNPDEISEIENVNVLFWNPHTINSPGQADTYNLPIE